jgi:hypothetical protein
VAERVARQAPPAQTHRDYDVGETSHATPA